MTNITLGKRPDRPGGTELFGLTTEVWNCLTECWRQNPEERITISKALALLNSTWVHHLAQGQTMICANSTRTRAESITVRASNPSRGDAMWHTTMKARKSASSPRQASGSRANDPQRSDLNVPSQPGLIGLQSSHHRRRVTRLRPATGEIGEEASSLTEKAPAASRLNPSRSQREKRPKRVKCLSRQCRSIFIPCFSMSFPALCSSCVSGKEIST